MAVSLSLIGVFGGRGGGGGQQVRCEEDLSEAYFPASGRAGGALKRGRGAVGSWGGVGSRCTVSSLPDLRGAGGGGGTPRRKPEDEEMLSDAGRAAGGGGGALACPALPVLTMLPVLPFAGWHRRWW